MDGEDIIAPRPGALTSPDARWRQAAPLSAFMSLSANIAASLTPGSGGPRRSACQHEYEHVQHHQRHE